MGAFADDLLAGLRARPRAVAPKWFYDEAGSLLFERICELPEYYPTRTEMSLLDRHAQEMAGCLGAGAEIIEFGAGASRKVRLLLSALQEPAGYVPVDISGEHLAAAAQRLRADHPGLVVRPVVGDYTAEGLNLPPPKGRRAGFYPGSSIGNFEPIEAARLLARLRQWLGGGGLLIGVDLVKSPAVLHSAYNDAQGVTAAFNLNLLVRANRELGCDFDLAGWEHAALYQPALQRIEMHLVSRRVQRVHVGAETFEFGDGESIHTENSYKYSVEGFQALARRAGWAPMRAWTDSARRFSVHWLESQPGAP